MAVWARALMQWMALEVHQEVEEKRPHMYLHHPFLQEPMSWGSVIRLMSTDGYDYAFTCQLGLPSGQYDVS